jgi:lambda family phage portal protein
MGGPIANGAIKTMRTNVVGTGLRLKPTIEADLLRLTPEQADTLKIQIEREFALWAESKYCDAAGLHNFYELQQLAFLSWMISGDVFALLPLIPEKHSLYDLRIKLVEADRCSTPTSGEAQDKDIRYGVEANANGRVIAYWFSSTHPGGVNFINNKPSKWTRVQARGSESGRRNLLHLMESERPEQRRGVPVLSPVIEALKQVARYTDAELMAAVISGMFTVFIETEAGEDADSFGLEYDNPTGEPLPSQDEDLRLGNGAVQFLNKGEKANVANPGRPNAQFDGFVKSILRQVGASLEIPYELLVKHFDSSYSASRAALLEAWKMFRMRRAWLSADFNQPIYEEWFVDAVVKGRINAPGLFDDPLIFRAYTKAEWHGPAQGQLDPVKEVNAAVTRMENGLSTGEKEAAELTGTDYSLNLQTRSREVELLKKYGLIKEVVQANEVAIEPDEGGEK